MDILEKTLQMVREHLPAPGTELGAYTFLAPDALWTGEAEGRPFVAAAEDRWPSGGGFFLAVTAEGPVYTAELDGFGLTGYCAAGFPQFMELMGLYQAAAASMVSPDADDEEGFRLCEEAGQELRRQAEEADPSAVEDEEGFWSCLIEELEMGM